MHLSGIWYVFFSSYQAIFLERLFGELNVNYDIYFPKHLNRYQSKVLDSVLTTTLLESYLLQHNSSLVRITQLLKRKRLFQEELRDNLTASVMSFVPTLDDDGKPLTCRAENPNVTTLYMETSWTINVVCQYT